ncbi:MAG: hypothetical protein ABIQ16_01245 [Polyangiaceae bacterium]
MKLLFGVVLVAVVSACSDQGNDPGAGGGAGHSNPGPMSDAGAGGEGSLESTPIWDHTSALLQIESGDFFSGYFGYERTRAQLSGAQLAELAQIHTAPTLDQCQEDGLNITFAVTDDAGAVRTFRNDSCRDEYPVVDPDAAEHFLNSLPKCLLSKDARTASLATAPSVAVGDGCQNGLFTSSAGETTPMWLRVKVPTANVPVSLELTSCGTRTFKLELLDEAGDAVLETGAPSDTSCSALSHSFDAPGSYVVRVALTGGTGAGDFTFQAN